MTLFDIASGISWTVNGKIFLVPKDGACNAELTLIDYLNDAESDIIDKDIAIITELNTMIETGSSAQVEEYIMNLNGFTEYDDGIYSFITGARDMSPSVLFAMNDASLFLIHPNFSIKDKFKITPIDLIKLLFLKKSIFEMINSSRIQEK